jgi:hypothetical protein
MAKLREQRRMAKALMNYLRRVPIPDQQSFNKLVDSAVKNALPEQEFIDYCEKHLFTLYESARASFRSLRLTPQQFRLDRVHKIQRLLESCIIDGYIEYITKTLYDRISLSTVPLPRIAKIGIRLTNTGEDITHIVGFCEELLKKYPLTWQNMLKIVGGISATIITSAAGSYLLIKIIDKIIKMPSMRS